MQTKICKLCTNLRGRFSKGLCQKHYSEYLKNRKTEVKLMHKKTKSDHVKIWMDYYKYNKEEFIHCASCYARAGEIHHIIYRSQGGKNDITNLIALCRNCHNRAHFKSEPFLKQEELSKYWSVFNNMRLKELENLKP